MLTELENFDYVLRLFMGQDVTETPHRKLPIYLVTNSGLTTIAPAARDRLAGFYTSSGEDIFAVATRGDNNHTLKHEYAHHFMMADFSYPYPGWFVEGFAEYYGATEFKLSETRIGVPNANRAAALSYLSWMSMSELLSNRPVTKAKNLDSYYPLAWLLTHWFMGDPNRRQQMATYLRDVGSGTDSVTALQNATGLTPTELNRTLRRYMGGRIPYSILKTEYPEVQIQVTVLPESADDLLLLGQRLKSGSTEENRQPTLEEIRRKAARYPDDTLALLILAHAELHNARDPEKAVEILDRLLAIDPNHVEALQYMARARMDLVDKALEANDDAAAGRHRQEAQAALRTAYTADDANYATFLLMAENRRGEPSYPTENDLEILALAYTLAPQLGEARFYYADALLRHDRNAEAIAVIEPLVNNPHGENPAAKALLLRAKGLTEADAAAEEEALRLKAEEEAEEDDTQTPPVAD
ncbi:hypothetical protein [Brevundimonas sp.]|uniref:hypothetical protein n=1 Tax=Brevundimonas sp. TaxID=1871086 RepID=UPI002FC66DDA